MADRPRPTTLPPPLTVPPPPRVRWSSAPPSPLGHTRLGAPGLALEAVNALLRWTEGLDDVRAISLWAGLSVTEDDSAREAALLRWVDWAGVTVPLGLKLKDLVRAVGKLLDELAATARDPDRVYAYGPADRVPMTRAMLGWMRARENSPGAVLGAARAIALAEEILRTSSPELRPQDERDSLELVPGDGHSPRLSTRDLAVRDPEALLADAMRRRVERAGGPEASDILEVHLRTTRPPSLAPWAESLTDFLLLEGELQATPATALAVLASTAPSVWRGWARPGHGASPRDALRAVRLLGALGHHPDLAEALDPATTVVVIEGLIELLTHPRFAVWSRAARALGRLAGALHGLSARLTSLLEVKGEGPLRLRAHAALGALSPGASLELQRRRRALCDAADPNLVPALSVGVAELDADTSSEWAELTSRFAQKGGPETWAVLALALRELALQHPAARPQLAVLAEELRARAEGFQGSGTDAEFAARAAVLAARATTPEEGETPWGLLANLVRSVGRDPASPGLGAEVEAFSRELDGQVTHALKASAQDAPRAAVRGAVLLEEVVDLLVEGDLAVVAARVADLGARRALQETVEALRTRLLKAVWAGLRRPSPATFSWRRWLLRTAAVLPRLGPAGRPEDLTREAVREQVFETLERVADDPLANRPPLQRYAASALEELSEALGVELASVLAWFAVRGSALPSRTRLRRAAVAGRDAVDRVHSLVAESGRPGADPAALARTLALLAGGEACRLGQVLDALGRECESLGARQPEPHWSGLPRFDLADLANLADTTRRLSGDATFALTLDGESPGRPVPGSVLADTAGRLNRMLTTTSLKFVDASRRAEIAQHYVSELGGLCEAIATACGPLLGAGVRTLLARALVAVRALAAQAAVDRDAGTKYIARLKVLRPLDSAHEGGMAHTYLAEGPAPGKRVVVKLLPWARFRGASAATARAMFEGEMERLTRIVHPNVVSIVDAGCVDEGAYIALEYIPGASLETLLRRFGRLPLRSLAPVVRDVARALAHLHARGIVHRDIKPGNILAQFDLLDGPPPVAAWDPTLLVRAVLIDFGIATEDTRVDPEAGVTGTPGYIAPESARGLDTVSPALDVYSLAVVIFEMLTGQNPYLEGGDGDVAAVLVRHGTMSLPWQKLPPEAARPDVVKLLADASQMDPRGRPTMAGFLSRWSAIFGL